jgi:hypothetical protein
MNFSSSGRGIGYFLFFTAAEAANEDNEKSQMNVFHLILFFIACR